MTRRHRTITTVTAAAAAVATVAACSGSDHAVGPRDVIREAVVEPGVTALQRADDLACDADAELIRAALAAFELLEGGPATDEAALVAAGYLRAESTLWDVAGGELVAEDAACG